MKPSGFTLIETLITLLIVSISFPALYRIEWQAMHEHNRLLDGTLALEAAQRKMEAWRSITTQTAYQQLTSGQQQSNAGVAGIELQQVWTVQSRSAPDYKKIDLVISWQRSGDTNRLTMSTIIARPLVTRGN